jgi:hypothetical protein
MRWGTMLVGSLTILRALSRYSCHQHMVDLFVTNVPGPQFPLYLLGARLMEAFPVVQVAGNVPLSVAALSYAGQLNIGIQSDPTASQTWTSSLTACASLWRSWARPRRPSPAEPSRPTSINSSSSAWVDEQRTPRRAVLTGTSVPCQGLPSPTR